MFESTNSSPSREQINQNFWENINSRSDYIKYEFSKTSDILKNYLEDDFIVQLNSSIIIQQNSSIDKNLSGLDGLIESMKAFHNEAMSDLIDILNGLYGIWNSIEDGASYAWRVIQGDFNRDPTVSEVILSGLISLIPVVDQVSDIRDLIANILILTDENERTNKENWVNLALTAIGIIPELGSVFKTLVKVIKHEQVKDINTLGQIMETCESYLRRIGVGDKIPWGDNPIKWIEERPWENIANKAKETIQLYLAKLSEQFTEFGSANKVNYTNNPRYTKVDKKLDDLATLTKSIAESIDKYIDDLLLDVQIICDKLMEKAENVAKSIHTIHIGGNSNNPTKATHQQSNRKIAVTSMRLTKVGCFKRVNSKEAEAQAKINIENDHPKGSKNLTVDEYLNRETDRQLKLQEDGINSLTVAEYEQSRHNFKANGRGNGLDQKQTREDYEEILLRRYQDEYQELSECSPECQKKAQQTTDDVMATLAALHNPDQVAGGSQSKVPMEMGLQSVNSSIGTLWTKKPNDDTMNESDRHLTRVDSIDKAVADLPADTDKTQTRMNVKLRRCP